MAEVIVSDLKQLLAEIAACRICEGQIPEPRPVLRGTSSARLLIIGQAPGSKVHASGIPWGDASGSRLRAWMGLTDAEFYDPSRVAIMPMGFCYPGKGKSGDLPPAPVCAPTWHHQVLQHLQKIECTLLIGLYAQRHYLSEAPDRLTDTVKNWRSYAPTQFAIPHPSPRKQLWLRRNAWFEQEVVPALQDRVRAIMRAA